MNREHSKESDFDPVYGLWSIPRSTSYEWMNACVNESVKPSKPMQGSNSTNRKTTAEVTDIYPDARGLFFVRSRCTLNKMKVRMTRGRLANCMRLR